MQGDDGSEYQENGLFERPLGQRCNGRNRDYSLRGINETVSVAFDRLQRFWDGFSALSPPETDSIRLRNTHRQK